MPVSSSNSARMRTSSGRRTGCRCASRCNRRRRGVGELILAELPGLAGLAPQRVVLVLAYVLLVLHGDAEKRTDHAHRHPGAEVADEVEAVGADERIEDLGAQVNARTPRGRSSSEAMKMRERMPRCAVWIGGSSKMNTPDGSFDVGLDQLEDPALSRAERPWSFSALSTSRKNG